MAHTPSPKANAYQVQQAAEFLARANMKENVTQVEIYQVRHILTLCGIRYEDM